jgi:hypothetical protein
VVNQESSGTIDIVWVTGKGDSYDPFKQDDAGRTPAPQLLCHHHAQLAASGNRVCQAFGKFPRLGPDELRTYQAYLLTERKLTPGTVINRMAALRYFFVKTLKHPNALKLI